MQWSAFQKCCDTLVEFLVEMMLHKASKDCKVWPNAGLNTNL